MYQISAFYFVSLKSYEQKTHFWPNRKIYSRPSDTPPEFIPDPRTHPKVWSPTLPYVQKPWKTEKKNLFQTLGHTPRIHSRPPDTPPVPAGPFWPAPLATNQAQNGFMDFAWPEHTKTTLTWLQPSATPKPSNQSPLRWLEMNQGGVTHNRYFMVSQVPGTRNGCKTHLGISTKFRDYLMDRKSRLPYWLFLTIKKSIKIYGSIKKRRLEHPNLT